MPDEGLSLAKFFRRIGDAVLDMKGLLKKVRKAKPSFSLARGEPKRKIPSFLQEFFRRRNAEWPEYVMLKVQISVVLLFASAVVLVAFPSWARKWFSFPSSGLCGICALPRSDPSEAGLRARLPRL